MMLLETKKNFITERILESLTIIVVMCNYTMSINFIIQCPVCLIQFTTKEEETF